MHRFKFGFLSIAVLFGGAAAHAAGESASNRDVREELDSDLKKLVDIPPPRLELIFHALDEPNFKLVEAEFTLDGNRLPVPSIAELEKMGEHTLFAGQVGHGQHTLTSQVTYSDEASIVFSDVGGYKWKVGNKFTFPAQRGLAVKVMTTPELVPTAKEIKDRIKVSSIATAKIVAKMEDGVMPPSPVANLGQILKDQAAEDAAKKAADEKAAAATAEADKKSKAEQAKLAVEQAVEVKKLAREQALATQKAKQEEAKAAKAQALADKRAKADEAKAARAQALADKKSKAEEAKAATAQALADKKANAEEAKAAKAQALADKKAKADEAKAAKTQALADKTSQPDEVKAAKAPDDQAAALLAAEYKRAKAEDAKAVLAAAGPDQGGKALAARSNLLADADPGPKNEGATGASGSTGATVDAPKAAEPVKAPEVKAPSKSVSVTAPLQEGGGVPLLYVLLGVLGVFALALVVYLVVRK
jgi:hypothetical protein